MEDTHENGGWTKVEKRKAKKLKVIEAKLDANPPRFMYVNAEIVKRKEAVGISDLRDFVLHIIADAPPAGWIRVQNPQNIQKVAVVLVPGLTSTVLSLPPLPTSATANPNLPLAIPLPSTSAPPSSASGDDDDRTEEAAAQLGGVPFIARTFSHACPTRAPGESTRMHSVLSTFFHGPVSGEEKKRRVTERIASERTVQKDPVHYVLSVEQMIENEYPIPSYMADVFDRPDDWVETPHQTAEGTPKIYAIDCEMCLSAEGKELARVCVIEYTSGKVEYDQLVKPPRPIVDYLTRFSGITAQALEPVTTTLPAVQEHILSLLTASPTPILLGHSLESDLRALKLSHPRCIDTALIYHHPRGRPLKPGLAWLTKKWCGREIQNRGEGGHDPEEDARACISLLRKKVSNGPGFGEFRTDLESIFERMARSQGRIGTGAIRSAVVDHGNPATWHGAKATTPIACKSDADVHRGMLDAIPSHQFVFGRLTELADTLGCTYAILSRVDPPPMSDAAHAAPKRLADVLATLEAQLTSLYAALPSRTALVVFSGHADPRRMSALNAKKSVFEAALRAGRTSDEADSEMWSSREGRELEEEVEKARRGLVFLSVKS
ncbi:ribonuclease H [Auriscalpium vulgare]|uniref:Ribonuclease H n=1 Tax=Auriscalpium vulgare TaxID=40419 RepID=A0ACB8RH80_9AGAM|nr:ribonuclease H [Auriscalpium vulgare]